MEHKLEQQNKERRADFGKTIIQIKKCRVVKSFQIETTVWKYNVLYVKNHLGSEKALLMYMYVWQYILYKDRKRRFKGTVS